ncbi:hypothetical protein D0Z08_13365 [Nocardioides immobilis]|uniref:Peptidase S9 prolyl oligopeptidase catalytic domain-containing protein n=1 Tax=Nocardioides immobilis TaxID=2049295 RepID=A0A417Y2E9_9ACTN|nr:hypothetical protein D0Z08_13365 [Nocardioides immobilis]
MERILPDGRTYFVRLPNCTPVDAPECTEILGRSRPVILFLHSAGAAEDATKADSWLTTLQRAAGNTILVFGVSKDSTRRWNGGLCCTTSAVDDVGYLTAIVDDLSDSWPINKARVGLLGHSNGGMLALRAICERPDAFAAVAALAATYGGPCDKAKTRIAQWHGAFDAKIPLDGGVVSLLGTTITFPPVAELTQRTAPGSYFMLRVTAGGGHALSSVEYRQAVAWLLTGRA